jgi:hypothetical protein
MLRGMIGHANGGGVTTSSLGRPRSVSAMPTGMTTGRTLFLPNSVGEHGERDSNDESYCNAKSKARERS